MQGPAFPGWLLAHDMRATRFSDIRRSGFLRSGLLVAASVLTGVSLTGAAPAQTTQTVPHSTLHHHSTPTTPAHESSAHASHKVPTQSLKPPHPTSPSTKTAHALTAAPAAKAASASPPAPPATPQPAPSATHPSDSQTPATPDAGKNPAVTPHKKLTRPQQIATLADQLTQAKTPEEAHMLEDRLEALRTAGLSPTTQLLLRRAQKDSQAEKPDDAVEDLSDALALQPESAILWRSRAQTRLAAGDFNAAVADLGEALQRDGRDAKSWALLSTVEEQRKDGPAALKAWQKVLELNPMADKNHKRLDALHIKAFGQPT
ncbi:tetratricopeptide repeat protein [Acetobacter orleanensis]|uniref:Uncharacterized protein n=1 Tax=Acetobacter orleanensis TaxID=104099 RepID=A0A4Y3TRX4_9PROT|nr:hypothetical protein [Acetobacter orleanensis]KXV64986.1 hypothetical protein AD949_05260 [Acetobacter orleanensis]PCD78886.1 hypothetical protein CO710_09770 [Acetobacter orleanensis]GAN69633.1 hypothetical protein Abol_048_047 [Acetobacter orleanensis JCM 7639]GEB83515.1 hypothetical protein AOR01nite_19920 [Acetobacter orleanensis]